MNAQDFRSLQEAYLDVVMNELDEGKIGVDDKLPSGKTPRRKMKNKASNLETDARIAGGVANSPSWRTSRAIRLGAKEQESSLKKRAKKIREVETNQQEQTDLYDIILSHLLDEGYAETQEQAEAIMVNMSEDWRESIVEEVLDEAEGSYGQTPKASAAYTALHTGKGKSKTKSLALKHAIRAAGDDNSNKPSPKRSKMTQSDRDYHRGQSENGGEDREGIDFDEFDTGASGPGGKPKGKKLERQRKTGVSAD
jgi:hypothetical protein